MKKIYYTWQQVEGACLDIARQMHVHYWRPDYIVGITRGGLALAASLSNRLGVPCETLKVSLRDGSACESNLWMAEDAFGCVPLEEQAVFKSRWDTSRRKNILVVDDINDSGATLDWIKQDWASGCYPDEKTWDTVWNKNVRFATLFDNAASKFGDVDYTANEINKLENDVWIVFPWEKQFLELSR